MKIFAILSIHSEGLLADWNRENEKLEVRVNDRVVQVNGIDGEEGASELIMTAEIQSADELDMLIFRPRSQEALPENGWQYLDPDGNVQGPFSLEMIQAKEAPLPENGWQYVDPHGNIQGPFSLEKMRDWNTKGYFEQDLAMRFDPNGDFIEFRQLFPAGTVPFVTSIAQRSQAKETLEAGEVASDEIENGAKRCKDCQMWLNGPQQYEDHCIGKKHRRHAGITGGAMSTGNGTVDATRENILSIINLLQALDSAQNADVNVPVADPHADTGVPWLFL